VASEDVASRESTDELLVHELFSARASERPDAVAISAPDALLTYGEAERRANQLAHHLRALGVGRESRVALCLPRSAAMVIAALGILKAGGAYVALDPSHPEERLGFMIGDCGADLVLTSEEMASQLDGSRATVVVVERRASELDLEPIVPPAITNLPGDLAYVIYTSGSTGSPKGVLVHHRGLGNLISWHQQTFAITAADRATQIASPAFDAAVWELWPYLTAGASVRIPAEEVRADPLATRDWLVAERITVTFLPTALAEIVMTLDWPRTTRLRYLLTGGDSLYSYPPPGLPFAVVNNYGPTEGTVVSTSGVVPAGESTAKAPSIGRPISGVQTYIVDEQLDEVPAGVAGELLIGGPSVAVGYLGQPALTAEKFIPDTFSGTPGARLYRTGDYVRQRPDGELDFCGRVDEQVQIRGNRVELGEISATLRRHPAVRSSVVAVDQQGSSDPRLIAYVVSDVPRPDAEELRAHLARQLPVYMVPAAFVYLDELPLMTSGKLDRTRLPPLSVAGWAEPPDSAGPQGELQEILEPIVAELLGVNRVGAQENFFLLGGHSLLGAQLIARISTRFGVEMSLRSLFDNPTVAEMAVEVERLLVVDIEAMSDAEAARLLAADSMATSESAGDERAPHAA
jgi:amino acid adenylation domain-containing protein